ncbi:hypothetical protein [Dipodfec virus UOA04_Rod_565]|nr:hypothetical protein [Dipodfec virus UOA04_Rod_565]
MEKKKNNCPYSDGMQTGTVSKPGIINLGKEFGGIQMVLIEQDRYALGLCGQQVAEALFATKAEAKAYIRKNIVEIALHGAFIITNAVLKQHEQIEKAKWQGEKEDTASHSEVNE